MTQNSYISFSAVDKSLLRNQRNERYVDFRERLKQNYWLLAFHIFIGYAVLVLTVVGVVFSQQNFPLLFWGVIPFASILIGYTVSALHLFMHEASHYNFAINKKKNDLLSNVFIGFLIGMETNYYRSVHFVHHRLIGTAADTEKSYFEGMTRTFFFETLTGVRLLKVIAHRAKNIKSNYGEQNGKRIITKNNFVFIAAILLHCLLVISLLCFAYWQAATAWVIGMGIMFPFFAMFRQTLEHRTPEAKAEIDYSIVDQGASHRMFGEGIVASTMGAAGFNFHLIHHWDPSIPYTRLKDVELFLLETPLRDELNASRTTYLKTFLLLFNR